MREHLVLPENMPEQIKRPERHGAVLRRGDYYNDFALEAGRVNAGGEVTFMAMYTEPGEDFDAIRTVFESIPDTKRADVRKNFTIDDFSRAVGPNGRINAIDRVLPGGKEAVEENTKEFEDSLTEMTDLGVNVTILNPIDSALGNAFPFTGRTHVKGSYVDNRSEGEAGTTKRESVFYVQTGNIEPDRNDLFIKFTGETAEKMIDIYKAVFSDTPPANDTTFEIGKGLELYYDSGKKGKSIIADTAKKLVAGAEKSVRNMSLFYPDVIVEELADAVDRNVDVRVVASKYYLDTENLISIDTIFWGMDKLSQAKAKLSGNGIPVIRDPFNWAHTKLLIVDDAVAFIGSHNLSQGGVNAGTREWQLKITDSEIVKALVRKFEDMATLADDKSNEDLH